MPIKKITDFKTREYLPQLSVDIVIIGYEEQKVKCLLLQVKDKWMLPGGYIKTDQSVEEAAEEVLELRTGLKEQHLQFLGVFGSADRNFKSEWLPFMDIINDLDVTIDDHDWFTQRFVTLTYYALVDIKKTQPQVSFFDKDWRWFSVGELPQMWMDHKDIVIYAREKLKEDIRHEHITYNLLPEQFTMPELHQLHQVILESPIDRSRFQKNMLATNRFERLPKLKKDSPGRSPYLYRIKR